MGPNIGNSLWFDIGTATPVSEDELLTREEDEYNEKIDLEVNSGKEIVPMGQTREKAVKTTEEEEIEPEEELSNVDADDSDEFDDGASPEFDSMGEEVEMAEGMNGSSVVDDPW